MKDQPIILTQDLTKIYGLGDAEVHALDGVDVRNYLVAVSPVSIKMLMLNMSEPTQAALALLALMTIATVLGALLHFVWNKRLADKVDRTVSAKIESVKQNKKSLAPELVAYPEIFSYGWLAVDYSWLCWSSWERSY